MREKRATKCTWCDVEHVKLYSHHVKPKSLGGTDADTVRICLLCHRAIHQFATNDELAKMTSLQQLGVVLMNRDYYQGGF